MYEGNACFHYLEKHNYWLGMCLHGKCNFCQNCPITHFSGGIPYKIVQLTNNKPPPLIYT